MNINTFRIENTDELIAKFEAVSASPYKEHARFKILTYELMQKEKNALLPLSNILKSCNKDSVKSMLIHGCPIDRDIPIFDKTNPLSDKYKTKKTFVAETFLEIVSQMLEMPILAYNTRNNGDFFHDVYAQASLSKHTDTKN